jgi:hypothetical protein
MSGRDRRGLNVPATAQQPHAPERAKRRSYASTTAVRALGNAER